MPDSSQKNICCKCSKPIGDVIGYPLKLGKLFYNSFICYDCHRKAQNDRLTSSRNSPNFQYIQSLVTSRRYALPYYFKGKHYAKIDGATYHKDLSYTRQKGGYGSFKSFYPKTNSEETIGIKKARGWANITVLREEKDIIKHLHGTQPYRESFEEFATNLNEKVYLYSAHLVIPYCEGKSLDKYVYHLTTRNLTFDQYFTEICKIMYALGLFVRDIHSKGVSHNDIKENNIIVNKINDKYEVYLIDYGMAEYFNRPYKHYHGEIPLNNCTPLEFFGSPKSAAPIINSKCDSYSMGTLFLRLIAMYFSHSDPQIYYYSPDELLKEILYCIPEDERMKNLLNQVENLYKKTPEQRMDVEEFNGRLEAHLTNSLEINISQGIALPLGCCVTYNQPPQFSPISTPEPFIVPSNSYTPSPQRPVLPTREAVGETIEAQPRQARKRLLSPSSYLEGLPNNKRKRF